MIKHIVRRRPTMKVRRLWRGLILASAALLLWATPVIAILAMEQIKGHAQDARRNLTAVRTELQRHETLHLHAVLDPGEVTELRAELTASRVQANELMANAEVLGLDNGRATVVRELVIRYGADVDRDLGALAADHAGPPAEVRHEQSHDLYHRIDNELLAADKVLVARVQAARLISIVGVAVVVLIALVVTGLVARRRKIAAIRHASELQVEARYRALVTESSDLVVVVDERGAPSYTSPSAQRDLPSLVAGGTVSILDLMHPDDRPNLAALVNQPAGRAGAVVGDRVECRLPRGGTGWGTYEIAVTDLRGDPAVAGLVLTARDVTEQRDLQHRIEQQARHDALTGLPNRRLLFERLAAAAAAGAAAGRADGAAGGAGAGADGGRADEGPTALIYVDLDGFKAVNDSLGHAAGDELLAEVARRIAAAVRAQDIVCRLGGDEFAVLLHQVADIAEADAVARRILAAIESDLSIAGRQARASASIGIALTGPGDAEGVPELRADELLNAADIAMYSAKQNRARIAHYQRDMYEATVRRAGLERDLHQALVRGEISVAYQPIVAVTTVGDAPISGVEALMRWHSPTWGQVSPAEFIPIAEDTGLIVSLGEYVLRTAATAVARWNAERPADDPLDLAVNVSVRQLERAEFVDAVAAVLAETGLPADLLTLEVTESLLLRDDCVSVLAEFRTLGMRVALDDFGTGYAALGYLNAVTVDQLKVDISFVRALGTQGGKENLTASILALAASLGLDAVAEGVETGEQLQRLESMGCPHAQGYLFSKPLQEIEISGLLRTRQPVS